MKTNLFSKTASAVAIAALLSTGFAASAQAVVTVGDTTCDLSGAGTKSSPYTIATAAELAEVMDCVPDGMELKADYKRFVMTADIDLTPGEETWNSVESGWTPIGNSSNFFRGSFDGAGHKITNLSINSAAGDLGLFGRIQGATIKNLTLDNSGGSYKITQANTAEYDYYVGALVAYTENSLIENITSNVDVLTASGYSGGVIGGINYSVVKNVTGSGDIEIQSDGQFDMDNIGGVIGDAVYSNISDVEYSGSIKAVTFAPNDQLVYGRWVGGVVGHLNYGSLHNAKNSASIVGAYGMGGVVGYADQAHMSNLENTGNLAFGFSDRKIQTNGFYFAGIAAYLGSGSVLEDSTSTGDITMYDSWAADYENYNVGGAVGYASELNTINNVHVESDIASNYAVYVGGLVGSFDGYAGKLTNSSFKGSVSNTYTRDVPIGGGIGGIYQTLEVNNVFIDATVNATAGVNVGGFAGFVALNRGQIVLRNIGVVGSVTGVDLVGGFIGQIDVPAMEIMNVYTAATVVATGEGADADPFANGQWNVGNDTNFVLDSELEDSSTGLMPTSQSDMQAKATYENAGWNFDEGAVRWAIAADKNNGYPYIEFGVADGGTDNGGGDNGGGEGENPAPDTLAGAHVSTKMFISVGASQFGTRRFVVNVSSKHQRKNAKLIVVRDGSVVQVLMNARLNRFGNRVFVSDFALETGDVLTLKVANRKFESLTIS